MITAAINWRFGLAELVACVLIYGARRREYIDNHVQAALHVVTKVLWFLIFIGAVR